MSDADFNTVIDAELAEFFNSIADEDAALAAKDARIAELEAETDLRWRQYQALGAETHARIAELEEALRWYAEQYCERWCKGTGRRAVFEDHCGGCRARAVLEKANA